MTATIRYVTRRANGRASVREVEVAGAALTAGRASGCEIHLPDLRVALVHARISMPTGQSVVVEAEGESALRVAGRVAKKAELPLAGGKPALVGVGPYELTFALGDGGRLVIEVNRAQADAARTKIDPDTVFSLQGTWLSKRWLAWALAVTLIAVGIAAPLAIWARKPVETVNFAHQQAGALWSTGVSSSAHSAFVQNCADCHEKAFVSVKDDTCLTCHAEVRHHADPERMEASAAARDPFKAGLQMAAATFGKPADRCTSCHVEHNGADGVIPQRQALCADCHRDLTAKVKDTPLRNVADFGRNHPDFKPTLTIKPDASAPLFMARWTIGELDQARKARDAAAPKDAKAADCDGFDIGKPNFRGLAQPPSGDGSPGDNSGLVFPHAVHLDPKGCVTAIAAKLPASAGYDSNGLDCANCHKPDDGGALFRPVEMERDCASCHSLVFETINGVDRELRHGQPVDVIASMLDFYQAKAVTFALEPGALAGARRRPGEAAQDRLLMLRQTAFASANAQAATRVRAIFSKGGACYGCHEIVEPANPGALDYGVKPVSLRDRFLPRGVFEHQSHAAQPCSDCHLAETSRSAVDVLLPDVASCQDCHRGEKAASGVPSTCVMCHGFHAEDGQTPLMKADARSAHAGLKGAPQ